MYYNALSQIRTVSPNDPLKMLTSSYSPEDIFLFCQIKMIFVYFVGTLDPALQDRDGQPRRNISTIAHILNDLLGASPNIDIARAGSLRQQLNKVTTNTQETGNYFYWSY
jgi:hypothetical protein